MVTRLWRTALLGVALTLGFLMPGCMRVGLANDGTPVFGFGVGPDGQMDTPDETALKGAAGVLGGFFGLPPGVGEALAGGALSLLGVGGIAVKRTARARADEADARERAAQAEGRHTGWDERELAATQVAFGPTADLRVSSSSPAPVPTEGA